MPSPSCLPLLCRLTKSIVSGFPRLGKEILQPNFHVFFVGFPPLNVYFDWFNWQAKTPWRGSIFIHAVHKINELQERNKKLNIFSNYVPGVWLNLTHTSIGWYMVKALNLIGKQLSLALPLTRSQFDFSLTYNFTLNSRSGFFECWIMLSTR